MGRLEPSNRTIIGIAVLLFAAVLVGVGIHHVVRTGTCSSTGYSSNFGPVPHCPKGSGWWALFIGGGIALSTGAGMVCGLRLMAVEFAAMFSAVGAGAISIAFDASARSSTKTFGLIFGGVFLAIGVVAGVIMGWGALSWRREAPAPDSPRGKTGTTGDPIMDAYTASAAARPARPASPPRPVPIPAPFVPRAPAEDPLDQIAKLAKLRERGALTEDEFTREKAKLLADR